MIAELIAAGALVVNAWVSLTWYDPALCHVAPINCHTPAEWWRMAAGHDARDYYNRAAACPPELPLGTLVILAADDTRYGLPAREWRCLDRGGAIKVRDDGVVMLDLLTTQPLWRDTIRATLVMP